MEFAERRSAKEAEKSFHYGKWLSDEIRAKTQDYSKLDEFERFVLRKGYRFHTEKGLRAGYERLQKAEQGILLTEEEFAAESCPFSMREDSYTPPETVAKVYEVLVNLVKKEKLTPSDVFAYAAYSWCLNEPEAIIAYQIDPCRDSPIYRKWAVNNCSTVIENSEARIEICEEFGFEASRIRIIGTPYYESTDWQFIRFDCAGMSWLWRNGSLYPVYQ